MPLVSSTHSYELVANWLLSTDGEASFPTALPQKRPENAYMYAHNLEMAAAPGPQHQAAFDSFWSAATGPCSLGLAGCSAATRLQPMPAALSEQA